MTRPAQQPPTGGGRRSLAERRTRDRRALLVGLALSVVLHVIVLGVFGDWLSPAPRPVPPRPSAVVVEPPRGLRVVEIRPVPETDVAAPERPEPRESRDPEEEAPPVVVAGGAVADTVPADARTAADRLAPRIVDPRLWQPMVLIPREPTFEDVQARVAAAVELLSDSALAAADAAIRARDWTVKDADGGRWGISPGQLHLGKLTLPLPVWMPVSYEADVAQQQWYEVDQQLERTRLLESFEERVRAIRERRERERAEARARENGGG